MKKSVVLLSGGMDSLLTMALCHARGDEIFSLHFNYGQRTFLKEKSCAEKISQFYKVPKQNQKYIDLNFLRDFGGSGLTDANIHLSTTGENLTKTETPSSYVPFRNTIMLSIATSWAETLKANNIVIGAVQDDELGYPDCRKIYFEAWQKVLQLGGSLASIQVETPLIFMNKIDIVKKLLSLNAPVEYSWSCYKNNDLACGTCDSCRLRLQAFKSCNVEDKLTYQN